MARKVTAHEATVQTVTVEVKTLTIGGRQVTLSVFRQLIREPVIDRDSGKLNGVPWGRVHYFPESSCADRAERGHLHIVWQKNDELRRSCVDPLRRGPVGKYQEATFRHEWEEVALTQEDRDRTEAIAFGLLAVEDPSAVIFEPEQPDMLEAIPTYATGIYRIAQGDFAWRYRGDGGSHDEPRAVIRRVAQLVQARDGRAYRQLTVDKVAAEIRSTVADVWAAGSEGGAAPATAAAALAALDRLRAEAQDETAAVRVKEVAYAGLYDQLAALPQLFIAT